MILCDKCKELIGTSAPVYKASRGFISEDGSFFEDESVVFHAECYHSYNPFEAIERKIINK
tara:strand:+ start:1772 stop:1954 length:183 start_codon:yes stop_codon:yes gene_type:complete